MLPVSLNFSFLIFSSGFSNVHLPTRVLRIPMYYMHKRICGHCRISDIYIIKIIVFHNNGLYPKLNKILTDYIIKQKWFSEVDVLSKVKT